MCICLAKRGQARVAQLHAILNCSCEDKKKDKGFIRETGGKFPWHVTEKQACLRFVSPSQNGQKHNGTTKPTYKHHLNRIKK